MSATVFGLASSTFYPQPDIRITKDETGLVTISQSFACKKASFSTTVLHQTFRRGVSFTTLNTDSAWSSFSYVVLETAEAEDSGGDVVVVYCTFKGTQQDFNLPGIGTQDSWEVTFSLNSSLVEAPILTNDKVRSLLQYSQNSNTIALFAGVLDGKYQRDPRENPTDVSSNITIIDSQTQTVVGTLTTTEEKNVWKLVVIDGVTTYLRPTLEWTAESTNAYQLGTKDFENMGKIHTQAQVDGQPETPSGRNWLLSGMQQTSTMGSYTRSKTYQLSGPDGWDENSYDDADYS